MNQAEISHDIATRAARLIVGESIEARQNWAEILVTMESILTIVVGFTAHREAPASQARWASEMLDLMTEKVNGRLVKFFEDEAAAKQAWSEEWI
jgi:hypothetical protein